MSDNRAASEVAIREFYNNFAPPAYVRPLVAGLASTVPARYLRGLDCVVLTNQSGAPRRQRLGKVTSRKRRFPQDRVLGRYHHAHSGKPAWIELYVDNLVAAVSYHPWLPMMRTACFGSTLFHEIGHHVDATMRPEFREKEDAADDWSKKFTANYFRKRYWFVPRPAWRLVIWSMKAIAERLKS